MTILINAFLALTTILALAVGGLYLFMKKKYRYWGSRNIPHAQPQFPFGNMAEMGRTKFPGAVFRDLYDQGKGHPVFGAWALHRPMLLIRDLDIAKNMLVRDFSHFHDHDFYYNEEKDPLSAHLIALEGIKWRNLRAKLTPTFTTGKMKMMFPLVVGCGEQLSQVLGDIADAEGTFEAKDILARFATDVISSCAFGIETNSLREPNSMFREMGRKMFEPTWSVILKNSITFLTPDLAALLRMTVTPNDVAEFFLKVFRETMDYREQNNVKRNDFMHLLIQLRTKGFIDDVDDSSRVLTDDDKFTFEQAAAQAFLFFIGGFETSSSMMQFILYEFALNPDIQEKTREEVMGALSRHEGQMNYEALHAMEYTSRVINETLRKYPPSTVLNRLCTKDYHIPDTDIVIEKGTAVMIPSYGVQMDPQFFTDPNRFDPDRFTEEAKAKMHHYAFIPFGEGPRHCIGLRFAQMQIRVGIVAILSKFRLEVCKKTPIPLEFDPKAFFFMPKGGMHLKVTRL